MAASHVATMPGDKEQGAAYARAVMGSDRLGAVPHVLTIGGA